MFHRQRQQQQIERAIEQFLDQVLGLGFAQMQIEIGKFVAYQRQQRRQHVRRDRRDHAEVQRSRQHAALPAGKVDDVAQFGENALARPAISRPASVSMTPLRLRSNNCTPRDFSSSWICIESAGWVTAHCSAALPKCRVRATASKYLSCLKRDHRSDFLI